MREMSDLQKPEIHLWFADLNSFDLLAGSNEFAHWLHAAEKDRFNRYKSQNQREQFLLGRVLLKTVLSRYVGCAQTD